MEEELEDEHSYRKELIARMFGGKLSSRQYGLLVGASYDTEEQNAVRKAVEFKQQLHAKDSIRNSEEILEEWRRSMVIQGNWTENESYSKL
jgi:hypothetical protein